MRKHETPIVKAIIDALEASRVWCWRVNSGLTVIGKGREKRAIHGAPAGTPDIIGILSSGRFFGLEVKTATGRQSSSQKDWERRAIAHSARYAVVRTIGDALLRVKCWESEDNRR